MKTKPYSPQENQKLQRIAEPAVSYGLSQEEDVIWEPTPGVPSTKEELIVRVEEALEDIAAGRVYTSEQVHSMMREKYPFLCK